MARALPRTRIQVDELDGSVWETAKRAPCPALAPYVLRMVGYDERSARPQRQRQFPETCVVLILEFGPPIRVALGGEARTAARHEGGFVASLGDAFAICEHDGRQRGVQVDLTPTGARRLFGLPLSELTGEVVALRDLFPCESRVLSERLDAERDWCRRLDLVEAFLARRILDATVETTRVDHALRRIHEAGGRLAMRALADELGTSHKHLISLFHDQVGVAPKLLARLVRFAAVMRAAQQGAPRSWAELALAYGFSDQAHLAREVRHFTGLTPTQARTELPSELSDLFYG